MWYESWPEYGLMPMIALIIVMLFVIAFWDR